MRKSYRGVEYDIHRLDDGRWAWDVYPPAREGVPFGDLAEDEAKATALCRTAIDTGLEERTLPTFAIPQNPRTE